MTDVDVAVVGAGVAGLTAAYELGKAGREARVFEAADVVGGRMTTLREDGYLIDTCAEQMAERGYEETWRLLAELGVDPAATPPIGRGIAMWRGRARPGVAQTRGLVTGAGLSVRARLDAARLIRGTFDTERPENSRLGEATVAEFAAPHHPDLLDYLLQPIVSGFFGWDPARSAAAPLLALLTAVGPPPTWRAYRDGMDTFARALAAKTDVTTGFPVDEVVDDGSSARLRGGAWEISARSVVLAVPAPVAARLHPRHGSAFLRECSFTPVVKAHLLLDRPLGGPDYALVVPTAENGTVSTVIFDHLKHPGRAPEGLGLVTLMAHPAVAPELLEASDEAVASRLTGAAEPLVPGLGSATRRAIVRRVRHAAPEATPRALALRGGFEAGLGRGVVDYAGDWVFLSPCSEAAVRSGVRAARRLAVRPAKERAR
ncbi:NAD(P)/FAD-dependent oxidoreductase [Amycolatopsis sp. EV170708-02-1]|uniref:protoporphyrinogen/coproporphyrinogen oxidase n=1 Tax=Amycolatopsis sp. EV170708-02-1 TaxID=2919322 RepID=UPI001F0C2A01|nr:NAD(P)/FAD-dependent oxidoreductase [Amycolatopsis sp. EV170708-02-1]UMO99906.1 FAD-dependent oxidoreductase [Amycolatopsis sp. EV170708-02-1]